MANSISKLQGQLLFVKIRDPKDCYDKEKGQEYTASVVVSEDTADQWNEIYKKQPAKKVKRSEFEAQYKCEPPEGDEKNLYVITLKKNTAWKNSDGELVPIDDKYRPRVYIRQDGELKDVTKTMLPANGSEGVVAVYTRNTDYGAIAQLQKVLVTKLVEYKTNDSDEDVFADAEDTEYVGVKVAEDKPEAKQKEVPAKKPAAKKAAKQEEEDFGEESPF